jgi:hypothetical protein
VSCFMSIALVPASAPDVTRAVDDLMRPHTVPSEEVKFEVPCCCVGKEARAHGKRMADLQHGPLSSLRERYCEARASLPWEERRTSPSWDDWRRPWHDTYQHEVQAHPNYGHADPACEFCNGSGSTGHSETWIVGDRRIDYFEIGRSFSGSFDPEYDPELDPLNTEQCPMCAGTGATREGGAECLWCVGKGTALKPVDEWPPFEGDIVPVPEILARPTWSPLGKETLRALESDRNASEPLRSQCESPPPIQSERWLSPEVTSVIEPDGTWHEWDPEDHDEEGVRGWARHVRAVLERHPDALAVVVECGLAD